MALYMTVPSCGLNHAPWLIIKSCYTVKTGIWLIIDLCLIYASSPSSSSLSSHPHTGVSLKTQELFLLVFVTRYLDLLTRFISLYNSVMKILYIGSTAAIVHMIRYREPYRSTYDKMQDSFRLEFAIVPCAVLALITNLIRGFGIIEVRLNMSRHDMTYIQEKKGSSMMTDASICFSTIQLLWTFSIYLEAVAILPQLIVLQRYSSVENLTGHYIFFMGAYRGLYILNWVSDLHIPFINTFMNSWPRRDIE